MKYNRNTKMQDHINSVLQSTKRFSCVGEVIKDSHLSAPLLFSMPEI